MHKLYFFVLRCSLNSLPAEHSACVDWGENFYPASPLAGTNRFVSPRLQCDSGILLTCYIRALTLKSDFVLYSWNESFKNGIAASGLYEMQAKVLHLWIMYAGF